MRATVANVAKELRAERRRRRSGSSISQGAASRTEVPFESARSGIIARVALERRDDNGRAWIAWIYDGYAASLQGGTADPTIYDEGIGSSKADGTPVTLGEALEWALARTDWVIVRPRWDPSVHYWAGRGPAPRIPELEQEDEIPVLTPGPHPLPVLPVGVQTFRVPAPTGRSRELRGQPLDDVHIADPAPSMRLSAPPYRDYMIEGVTRSEALAMCDQIVAETPELASTYLRWLVDELRSAGWATPSDDPTPGGV